ncbi:MAG: hypothetical protein ACTSXT_08170 [Candidatus Helarchaeota archaeon]
MNLFKRKKRYNTVIDMIKNTSSPEFFMKFLLHDIQKTFSNKKYSDSLVKHSCYQYQCYFRFYLDEYPEQKLLRKAWFQKRDDVYFIKNVINYAKVKSESVNTNETYWINRWEKAK